MKVEEMMKQMDVNDAGAIYALGNWYCHGGLGLLPDREKARELLT
jgi:TPR repeat protein